jgi:hypothetical protein
VTDLHTRNSPVKRNLAVDSKAWPPTAAMLLWLAETRSSW